MGKRQSADGRMTIVRNMTRSTEPELSPVSSAFIGGYYASGFAFFPRTLRPNACYEPVPPTVIPSILSVG